jgi:hypothetical protein
VKGMLPIVHRFQVGETFICKKSRLSLLNGRDACKCYHNSMEVRSLIFLFYSYVHTMFGLFLPPSPPPPPLTTSPTPSSPLPPRFQAETILPLSQILFLSQILLKRELSNNRKDQGFLVVEIRIAIQGVDSHCFPVHMCYI